MSCCKTNICNPMIHEPGCNQCRDCGRLHRANKELAAQCNAWKAAAETLANLKKDKHSGRCRLTSNRSAGACTCGLHQAWKYMAEAKKLEED